MKKKPWTKQPWQEFEKRIDDLAIKAGLTWESDSTVTDARVRRKDLKVDRIYKLGEKDRVAVELKSTTAKQSLDYSLYDDGRTHKIKIHQIIVADYFIIEYRPNPMLLIKKYDFLAWACTKTKNSLSYKDAKSIGIEIDSMEWVKKDIKSLCKNA